MKRLIIQFMVIICLIFFFPFLEGQDTNDTIQPGNNSQKLIIGGEMRARMRMYKGINFGDVDITENDYDTYLNLRAIISADLKINRTFGIYAQIGTANTLYKDDLSSSDKDILDFYQAYVDINLNVIPVSFRLGRQILSYGSGKVLGTSDSPNVVRSFDGARSVVDLGKTTGDFMFAFPVANSMEFIDNKANTDICFYGTYWQTSLSKSLSLDLYFFGNHLKDITIDDITANENRYSLGARFYKDAGPLNFENEAAWQVGNHGTRGISAFYMSTSARYTWEDSGLHPSIQLRGTMYSGDTDSTDAKVNIFRPVYARPPVNNMVPIGPSNIFMIVPEGQILLTEKIELSLRYYAIWRCTANDGLYSGRMDSKTREPDTEEFKKGSFITTGFYAQSSYDITDHLNISYSTGIFFAGEYLNNTGKGENVRANFLIATYEF